ncbi:ABC transporter permease [Candidatus Poriferisodalis sp.]|uniref:ABC transporter permease n=1 Tax=Candidatus Poriferisodalis sp. TaxID=3101277 RepID=UPI003B5B5B34
MTDTTAPALTGGGLTRRVGFVTDIATIARRAVRSVLREPEFVGPALIIPVFFFVVNVGALEPFVEAGAAAGAGAGPMSGGVADYRAFQLPVAIIFAVTGISRASVLVIDIQSGYLDRMLVTPIRRSTLLLGLMVADIVMALGLALFVIVMGLAFGVWFETGVLGLAVFLLLSIAWSLAFTGFPYTVALRTGNPAAVNSAFLIFFPFAFLTPAFLPRELMSGWMRAVAAWNPVTYLLEGMRTILSTGWDGVALAKGAAAILGLAVVTFFMAFRSLARRVATG